MSTEPNLIECLYIAQVDNAATPLLDWLAADLHVLNQGIEAGSRLALRKALITSALDYYYHRDPALTTSFFELDGDVIGVDLSRIGVSGSVLKSPGLFVKALYGLVSDSERGFVDAAACQLGPLARSRGRHGNELERRRWRRRRCNRKRTGRQPGRRRRQ